MNKVIRTLILLLLFFPVQLLPIKKIDTQKQSPEIKTVNFVDELVFKKLKEEKIPTSPLCTDETFIRRLYLSTLGTLPENKEVRSFCADTSPDKRKTLIDKVLQRDEFADFWAMKWCDILRVKAELPSNLWPVAAEAYHKWIKDRIRENMPYNKFAYTLLISSGSNFKNPPVNFYRALPKKEPLAILDEAALVFMGARTKYWSEDKRYGMAAFFAKVGYKATLEWKEEIIYLNSDGKFINPKTGKAEEPAFIDGSPAVVTQGQDPRIVFADWLTNPQNKWFTKNIVNRVWYWLMGKGIINEPDDIRPDNPAQNEELLARLEKELIDNKYDLKSIYRAILNSSAFQLSSIPVKKNKDDEENFSHYYLRQLDAEVLIDAINKITGSGDAYSSQTPEPYTYIPEDEKTVALSDGSITSPFLEIFGRPPRDTGLESERDNTPSTQQRLHLLNSTHIQKKLQSSQVIKDIVKQDKDVTKIITDLYINILSRFPSAEEIKTAENYFSANKQNKTESAIDLAWALINTTEFSFQH